MRLALSVLPGAFSWDTRSPGFPSFDVLPFAEPSEAGPDFVEWRQPTMKARAAIIHIPVNGVQVTSRPNNQNTRTRRVPAGSAISISRLAQERVELRDRRQCRQSQCALRR